MGSQEQFDLNKEHYILDPLTYSVVVKSKSKYQQ